MDRWNFINPFGKLRINNLHCRGEEWRSVVKVKEFRYFWPANQNKMENMHERVKTRWHGWLTVSDLVLYIYIKKAKLN